MRIDLSLLTKRYALDEDRIFLDFVASLRTRMLHQSSLSCYLSLFSGKCFQTFILGNLDFSHDCPQAVQVEILFPVWASLNLINLEERKDFIDLSVSVPWS